MNRKKAYLWTALLCTAFLAACGRKEDRDEEREYAKASLFCDVDFWEYPAWKVQEGTITGEITEKTGLALDVMQPTQDMDTQLRLMLLNDELPDIVSVTDSVTISQLVSSGKVWRIDEFLETYKPDSHILQDFPEDIKRELIRRDGAWYAFPSHMNSADARKQWETVPYMEEVIRHNDNNAIIWNKELLARAGLEPEDLQTQEQVLAAFGKVKDMGLSVDGEEVIVLLVDGKDYQDPTLKYLEGTFGAEWVDDEGNYRDIILQPQTKNALSFLNECIRQSYASPGQLTMETEEIQRLMQSGRVLCFIGNVANTGVAHKDWLSTGVILASDGSAPVLGKNMRASTGWISTFIARDCEHPEEIAAFLDYMTSREGMALWVYGREGTDYYVGEDGCYYRMERDDAEAEEQDRLDIWWMFSNTAWVRSVIVLTEETISENEIVTAYGMHERTKLYDSSLLIMPVDLLAGDSEAEGMEKEILAWKDSQIVKVLLAESQEGFEQEYQILIQGLYDRGIERLDKIRGEGYLANCREYGSCITKVNKTDGGAEE